MRTASSTHRPTSATRGGITARMAAHRYREPIVREIPRRGVVMQSRATIARRSA